MFISRQLSSSAAASGGSKKVVELLFDPVSPFTYFQFELLSRQQQQWNSMQLKYTPVSIASIMRKAENPPPLMVPAKAMYMMKDLSRLSKFYKVPLKMREDFPEFAMTKGTMDTQRFMVAMQQILAESNQETKFESLIRAFFQQFFSETSADINEPDVIKKISLEAGFPSGQVDKALNDLSTDPVKAKLKENSNRAFELGAFGLPATLLHFPNETKLIFGSDRMHLIGHMLGETNPPILTN